METKETERTVIGWKERVDLPEWGIRRLRAKTDTGAKTSAVHVSSMEELPNGRLRFEVVTRERPRVRTVTVEAEPIGHKVVKSGPGVRETRPIVETRVEIGPIRRKILVNLVCREGMLCRMLLGRSALQGLVVDPNRSYLLTASPPKRISK